MCDLVALARCCKVGQFLYLIIIIKRTSTGRAIKKVTP